MERIEEESGGGGRIGINEDERLRTSLRLCRRSSLAREVGEVAETEEKRMGAVPEWRCDEVLGCRSAGVPERRGAGVPWCLTARVPGCRSGVVPEWRGAGVAWCRTARVPDCQGARVPEWRGVGVAW